MEVTKSSFSYLVMTLSSILTLSSKKVCHYLFHIWTCNCINKNYKRKTE